MTPPNFPRNGKAFHLFRKLLIALNQDLFYISSKVTPYHFDFDEFDYLVMALEDRRYLNHRGIDILSVIRESFKMLTLRKHGGASTIDMQMVRTLTGYRETTLKRKLYEMLLAFIVNFRFSKYQIMKCYMDNAFFGSHMIGVSSACQKMFGKSLQELSNLEKSLIAAMLLRPKPRKPNDKWELAVNSRAAYAQAMRRFVKKSN